MILKRYIRHSITLQVFIQVGKWPLTTKPDDGVICGFCPLTMPSAASQLISLDLFSSGQRNGFDLASFCYGSFSLLVGFDLLDLSALAMLEFLWDFNSKTGSILLIDFPLPKKLTLCSFQPANQRECRWIILLWAT